MRSQRTAHTQANQATAEQVNEMNIDRVSSYICVLVCDFNLLFDSQFFDLLLRTKLN